MPKVAKLAHTLADVRACTHCAQYLPLGPRPVVRAAETARLIIIGQAPGTRVHESGVPWDDRSGERLRDWMGLKPKTFYDENKIAIMPMGFCYPGSAGGGAPSVRDGGKKKPSGGDNPPRPECAPLWHQQLLDHMPNIQLTLIVGQYAQKYYLGTERGKSLTQTVSNYDQYLANGMLPLPHPSWRVVGWQKKNPWFETDLLPVLKSHVLTVLR